jgi:type VI secretion system secreted protein Hcp
MAHADFYLKIDGIDGESQDDKHKNQIEVEDFSWGAANQGTSASGGGGGAGRVAMHDFIIWKQVDKASPKILEACCTGKHISSAVLSCCKQGGSQQEYIKITLSDVLVSGYRTEALASLPEIKGTTQGGVKPGLADEPPPIPIEEISLNFGKIEYEYREQDSKGNMAGPVKTIWNAKTNKGS